MIFPPCDSREGVFLKLIAVLKSPCSVGPAFPCRAIFSAPPTLATARKEARDEMLERSNKVPTRFSVA